VRPDGVVVALPGRQGRTGVSEQGDSFSFSSSSLNRPLKLSTKAFWVGLPGAM
jgi:hypothetical protein